MEGKHTPPGSLDLDHLTRWAEAVATGVQLDRQGDEGDSMTVLDGDLMATDETDLAERVTRLEQTVKAQGTQLAVLKRGFGRAGKAIKMIARTMRAGAMAEGILDGNGPPKPSGSETG